MNTELKPRSTSPIGTHPTGVGAADRTSVHNLAGRDQRNPAVVTAEVVAVAGLAATAYVHLEEPSGKFAEVPYLGGGYALLAIACAVSIVMTRTVGLPGSTDDIGNWSESIRVVWPTSATAPAD